MKDVDGSVDRDAFAARAVKHPDGNTYWNPMDVYKLLGSNMHVVMQPQLWVSGDPLELFPGVAWESVLASAVDALKVLALGEDDDDEPTGSPSLDFFTFFFLLPDPSGPVSSAPPSNYCVPTPFLRGLVVHGMCTVTELPQRRALLRKLQRNGQLRDAVFEAAVLAHISEAHVTVRVRGVLPASESRSLVIGPRASGPAYVAYEYNDHQKLLPPPEDCRVKRAAVECDLYAKPVPFIPDQPGFYLCPPGFPGADAIIIADGEGEGEVPERYEIIVRAIVEAKVKPTSSNVNQRGIDIITKALDQHTAPRKRTRLFIFVSDTAEKSEKLMETKVPGWTVGSVTLTAQDLVGSAT